MPRHTYPKEHATMNAMNDKQDTPLGSAVIDRLLQQIVHGRIVPDVEYVGRVGNVVTLRAASRRREYRVTIEAVR